MSLLNTDILKHPINWVIVILMALIGSVAIELALTAYKKASTQVKDQNTLTAG